MKFILIFLSILIPTYLAKANDNQEFRTTWVVSWFQINEQATVEQNQATIRKIMDLHEQANMNAVIWQVRQSGTAYYPSSYEPWGKYAGYQDPGYNHLEYAVEEAHKRGMELHAWFNVFHASDTTSGAPAMKHPQWICRDGSGNQMPSSYCLSPGMEEVRDYTLQVAMEIVRNYDIDGLLLDYIRWNEYDNSDLSKALAKKSADNHEIFDGMISEEQIQNLLKVNSVNRYLYDIEHPYSAGIPDSIPDNKFSSWESWWRWSVTQFVRVLHDSIQAVKPWVRLSAAALGRYNWDSWNGYYSVYQDAALWFNQGYIDQLTPMHYHWSTGNEFYDMLTQGWQPYLQVGIAEGRLYSVGPASYKLDENNQWSNHEQIVQRCRDVIWNDGFQFYNYGNWYSHQYWQDAREKFFDRKTKVRAVKFLLDITPDQPSISLNALDSLHYEITVNPPASIIENQRFAIYRSEDENLDVAADEIIDIHFGQESFGFIDSLSGFQDFNGKYTYYATMLDRFWNESNISNTYTSDSIPSFAPQILETVPGEGDTIAINGTITVIFSKSMDTVTFQDGVFIDPPVAFSTLTWSEDNKKLLITFQNNFAYSSDYILTIDKDVADINGKSLFGIGDEDFTLSFHTKAVDDIGPKVIYSNPRLDAVVTEFDIEDVITMAFDELIEPSTIDESSVAISNGLHIISAYTKVFTSYNNQSIIAVQPSDPFPLTPMQEYTVSFTNAITDTGGNPMDSTVSIYFLTQPYEYSEKIMIDNFTGSGAWESPDYSGTTNGINAALSYFEINTNYYLPINTTFAQKKSGKLQYVWDPAFLDPPGSEFILREYLNASPPRDITFDSTYTLQCYIFGDGSQNKFRFAVDDNVPEPAAVNHEVSPWYTIDWTGWKLISWDMENDGTGSWLGDGHLNGTLRFDSFQLTHDQGNAISGALYFKDLRVVKKEYSTLGDIVEEEIEPKTYFLAQNYPNPFNAQTKIDFTIIAPGKTNLIIYDVLGRKVAHLIDKYLQSGDYSITFDASNLASGLYIYQLRSNGVFLRRKMILVR